MLLKVYVIKRQLVCTEVNKQLKFGFRCRNQTPKARQELNRKQTHAHNIFVNQI